MGLGVLGEFLHRCPLDSVASWAVAHILNGFERHEVVDYVDKVVSRLHEYRLACGPPEEAAAVARPRRVRTAVVRSVTCGG